MKTDVKPEEFARYIGNHQRAYSSEDAEEKKQAVQGLARLLNMNDRKAEEFLDKKPKGRRYVDGALMQLGIDPDEVFNE